jgi:DNA-binding beta-propeller fold protein YncE
VHTSSCRLQQKDPLTVVSATIIPQGEFTVQGRRRRMAPLAAQLLSRLLLVSAIAIVSHPAAAGDLDELPVGTIQNFGPDLQTVAGGVCRQPEGLAIDPDGNLYAASNSDAATTVGYVCVIDREGKLVDTIAVPAGPGAAAVGLLGELWEDGALYVLDQADDLPTHGRILKINPRTHAVATVATGLTFPNGMAEDRHGNI